MINRVEVQFNIKPERLIGDTANGDEVEVGSILRNKLELRSREELVEIIIRDNCSGQLIPDTTLSFFSA